MSLPDASRRLFAHYGPGAVGTATPAFLVERLLEEGDGADLHWLTSAFSEESLASWLASRGGRRLSHRSRRFWETVLGVRVEPAPVDREALWPL